MPAGSHPVWGLVRIRVYCAPMSSCYDLHSHSTASDGLFAPASLVAKAREEGVAVLALTDHDTTQGLAEAHLAARDERVVLVAGVEISVTWRGALVHVVGLGIDPANPALAAGLGRLQDYRVWRAGEMARRLERAGIPGALEGARQRAGEGQIGRTHFARFLVAGGHAADLKRAFLRYLKPGRPGYVPSRWAGLEEAVDWIAGSGGQAVIAHPARYGFTATRLRSLLADFKSCGGVGLEVVTGTHNPSEVRSMAELARRFALLASCGSDFHGRDDGWGQLGRLQPLPDGCIPIWRDWDLQGTDQGHAKSARLG